jgi:hypothetical protein
MESRFYGIVFLFILLFVIFAIKPNILYKMYSNWIGRLLFLIFLIYCTNYNSTLGLLLTLIIVLISTPYSYEGFNNNNLAQVNNNTLYPASIKKNNQNATNSYIDPITVHESLKSISSNTIPVSSIQPYTDPIPADPISSSLTGEYSRY